METRLKRSQTAIQADTKAVATDLAAASGAVLLTPAQLAIRLNVPCSWVREKTRQRARIRDQDPLPVVRLGKYVRFRWSDVEAWVTRRASNTPS